MILRRFCYFWLTLLALLPMSWANLADQAKYFADQLDSRYASDSTAYEIDKIGYLTQLTMQLEELRKKPNTTLQQLLALQTKLAYLQPSAANWRNTIETMRKMDHDEALAATWFALTFKFVTTSTTADYSAKHQLQQWIAEDGLNVDESELQWLLKYYEDSNGFSSYHGRYRTKEMLQQAFDLRFPYIKQINALSDSEKPQICIETSAPLQLPKTEYHIEDYVSIIPAAQINVSIRGSQLCLAGALRHNETYTVTTRAGLRFENGQKTVATWSDEVRIISRTPQLSFSSSRYILPAYGAHHVPLTSVNFTQAYIEVLHINDRSLIEQVRDYGNNALESHELRNLKSKIATSIWKGTVTINNQAEQDVVTALPADAMIAVHEPGIYLIYAYGLGESETFESFDDSDYYSSRQQASQWLIISDLGITTYWAKDGMYAQVRSLQTAQPLANVQLQLLATNNKVLDTALTDQNGLVRFPAGVLTGEGSSQPYLLMAESKIAQKKQKEKNKQSVDFNWLKLNQSALDLSNFDISGREIIGSQDAYLYTERGVYRPGETVYLTAILRDSQVAALAQNLPLTLKWTRPDTNEVAQQQVQPTGGGGYQQAFTLPGNAQYGQWRVAAYTDVKSQPVGQIKFLVEDYVPPRIRVKLEPLSRSWALPDDSLQLRVASDFYYGAPAAELPASASLRFMRDSKPFPAYSQFHFGLATPEKLPELPEVSQEATTDHDGKVAFQLDLPLVPQLRDPIKAVAHMEVKEPGGRGVQDSAEISLRQYPFYIGVRSLQGSEVAYDKTELSFELIVLDEAGKPKKNQQVNYQLVYEEYDYFWYFLNKEWNYKLSYQDAETIETGTFTSTATPQKLTLKMGAQRWWGAYRLDVFDEQTGAISSLRLRKGWYGGDGDQISPDKLDITLDQAAYAIGDTVTLRFKAPFDGAAQLMLMNDQLLNKQEIKLVKDQEQTLQLEVPETIGVGAYALVTAYRDQSQQAPAAANANIAQQIPQPHRMLGIAWIKPQATAQQLKIELQAESEYRPNRTAEIPLQLSAMQGKQAWVTLAAVDEGVLQLTRFDSPNPFSYFFQKRKLSVLLHDLYGRLLQPAGTLGKLNVGGDGDDDADEMGENTSTIKGLALFSGILPVDESGKVIVPLSFPEFSGEVRLMAVAWTSNQLGSAAKAVKVRDALDAQVYLPRFIRRGDTAQVNVRVSNIVAPAGAYQLRLQASNGLKLADLQQTIQLDGSAKIVFNQDVSLQGEAIGRGDLQLVIQGPDGFSLERSWQLDIQPPVPIQQFTLLQQLEAKQSIQVQNLPGDRWKEFIMQSQVDLTVSAQPPLDVQGLLDQLDRYPYGCLEQTTSRALPLLYTKEISQKFAAKFSAQTDPVPAAIQRIMGMQNNDGSFGYWRTGSPSLWGSGYATDFLTRAKEQNYYVNANRYQKALEWLKVNGSESPAAQYTLARAGSPQRSTMRYLINEKTWDDFALAQLLAGLTLAGDSEFANRHIPALIQRNASIDDRIYGYYGSALRDRTAILAMLLEAGVKIPQLSQKMAQIAAQYADRRYLSTQELFWGLQFARLSQTDQVAPVEVLLDQTAVPAATATRAKATQQLQNNGKSEVWLTTSWQGYDPQAQAHSGGYSVQRELYNEQGERLNPESIDNERYEWPQGQRVIVVITVERNSQQTTWKDALVVDWIAAGLEIENASLGGLSTDQFPWIGKLTPLLHEESRDDRFVAAIAEDSPQQVRFAYILQTVTPGTYLQPGTVVEDMYNPEFFTRTGAETLIVTKKSR